MWIKDGQEFTEDMIPANALGFIYEMSCIYNGTSYRYIGKKNFYSETKKKMGKKELALVTDKRLKKYTVVKKLAYKNYFSSNEVLKQAHSEGVLIKREILAICYNATELTYMECKLQFCLGVLEKEEFLNRNILGRFFKMNEDEKRKINS